MFLDFIVEGASQPTCTFFLFPSLKQNLQMQNCRYRQQKLKCTRSFSKFLPIMANMREVYICK